MSYTDLMPHATCLEYIS